MTNTKSFEILSINRTAESISPGAVFVYLDEDVPFSDGSQSYINFAKVYPFTNWQAGDSISIDLDRVRYRRGSEYINDSQIAWQNTYPCSENYCSRKKAVDDNYCNYHHRQYKNQVKQKTPIPSTIQDVAKFNAWWNNNLATVVNGDGYFTIYLLVYDGGSGIKPFQSSSNSYNLSNAKGQASTLRTNLNGNNPILYIHPKANSYASFGEIINDYSGFIVKINNLPVELKEEVEWNPSLEKEVRYSWYTTTNQPNNYLKPLDIVWIKKRAFADTIPYYHVGIYLDNNEIFEITGDIFKRKGARVGSWKDFVGDLDGEIFAYRTIIPFKHFKLIASQIARAENIQWREGDYCLGNQNCEHAANMLVYGIEYSKQSAERNIPEWTKKYSGINWGKSGFNLTSEINRTNNQLGQDNNWMAQQIVQQVRFHIPIKNNWWL